MVTTTPYPVPYAAMHYADELQRCKRYYEEQGGTANGDIFYRDHMSTADTFRTPRPMVQKQAIPTVTKVGTWYIAGTATGQPTVAYPGVDSYCFAQAVTGDGIFQCNTTGSSTYITLDAGY